MSFFTHGSVTLGYDKFYDNTDTIGIVDGDVEPFEFLTSKAIQNTFIKQSDEPELPQVFFEVSFSDS